MPVCDATTCPLLQPAQLPGSSAQAFVGSCSHSMWPDAAHVHTNRSQQAPCQTTSERGWREDTTQGPAAMAGGATQEALLDRASCSSGPAAEQGGPAAALASKMGQQWFSYGAEPSKPALKPPLYPRKGAAGSTPSAAEVRASEADTAQHWLLLRFSSKALEQRYVQWQAANFFLKVWTPWTLCCQLLAAKATHMLKQDGEHAVMLTGAR